VPRILFEELPTMAMSVGGSQEGGAIATINTTPLVDVMLVMLIIFLITIPVITKTVKVDLPRAVNIPTQTKPENITIAVDKNGNIYWNDKMVANRGELLGLIEAAAVRKPQPEIHIRGDKETRYEAIGRVMYAIQRGGIVKVGFLTEPDHGVRGYR
jgi:biopolymer transport protein ExbD